MTAMNAVASLIAAVPAGRTFTVVFGAADRPAVCLGTFTTEELACGHLDNIAPTLLDPDSTEYVEDHHRQVGIVAQSTVTVLVVTRLAGLVLDSVHIDAAGNAIWIEHQ